MILTIIKHRSTFIVRVQANKYFGSDRSRTPYPGLLETLNVRQPMRFLLFDGRSL